MGLLLHCGTLITEFKMVTAVIINNIGETVRPLVPRLEAHMGREAEDISQCPAQIIHLKRSSYSISTTGDNESVNVGGSVNAYVVTLFIVCKL